MKGENDVIGGEGVSVGPKNSGAKVKGESFIVGRDFPSRGEARLDLLGDGVVVDEGIEKKADESAGGGVFRDEGVKSGRFARGGVDKDPTLPSGLGSGSVQSLGKRIVGAHFFGFGSTGLRGHGNKREEKQSAKVHKSES